MNSRTLAMNHSKRYQDELNGSGNYVSHAVKVETIRRQIEVEASWFDTYTKRGEHDKAATIAKFLDKLTNDLAQLMVEEQAYLALYNDNRAAIEDNSDCGTRFIISGGEVLEV